MSEPGYLVIREGAKWSDVFRLVPGQGVTIGRAPTNQIVIQDERASRNHAELFFSEDRWVLRDLDSRNGTFVGEQAIHEDRPLVPGEVIRIGRCQLIYVNTLTQAFHDSGPVPQSVEAGAVERTETSIPPPPAAAEEPATITHRRGQTRFLELGREGEDAQAGAAAARLCRLAFELAKTPEAAKMGDLALAGLFESIEVEAGGVLVFPRDYRNAPEAAELEVISTLSSPGHHYHRLPHALGNTVMREGEAVLARNVHGDSAVSSRDSNGEISATSVICAPIRHAKATYGLIHLYSRSPQCTPTPEDLEFTLAVADTLAVALTNLTRQQDLADHLTQMRIENVELRERLGVQSEIVGQSVSMRHLTEEIARAAASKATVLIRGESGVGKELVARAVHNSSPRRNNPFICLNCAALSEDLLASELFGHEKGAFTGATDRKIGKFEAADSGTLMLDEIGEMSPGIQAKFLRVLEGHSFERVGGNKPIHVDVRVIAATNRDLEKDAAEGRFRRDLFFRLRVLEVLVPALRKRPEDIVQLAHHFLDKYKAETGRKIQGFTPRAMEQLVAYRWPGNVRELKNVVERAVVLCRGEYIDIEDLLLSKLATAGDTMETPLVAAAFQPCSLEDIERQHILATLNHLNWNKSRAAIVLGIERSTLDRKIRRYALAEEPAGGRRLSRAEEAG